MVGLDEVEVVVVVVHGGVGNQVSSAVEPG